jgi:tetratricopeptide (TPR) repeat protein
MSAPDDHHPIAAPRPHQRWLLPAIFLVAALLRALYFSELVDSPEFTAPALDAAFHDHWARALVSGDWSAPRFFADPQIQTTPYFRPPAYPFFLAALYAVSGGSPFAARALQMLLGLVSVGMGFRLGRLLFGRTAGLVAAAGMASTWTLVYFEGELMEPVLVVSILQSLVLVWHRWWQVGGFWRSGLGGLLLGLFALARPNALALIPVIAIWAWWSLVRRGLRAQRRPTLLGLALGVIAAIAPVTIRNYVVAGEFVVITSNGGVNLYIGNNPGADGYTARIPILHELAAVQGWTCFDQPAIVRGVERLEGRRLSAGEVSDFFARKAFEFVWAQPGRALALMVKKAALFFGPIEVANDRELEVERAHSWLLRWLPGFPFVLSLGVVGAFMLWRELLRVRDVERMQLAVLLVAIGAVWFASHLPFFVADRYRVPLVPLLWLAAGYGVSGVLDLWHRGEKRDAWRWVGTWLVVLLVAHVPWTDYRPNPGRWHFQRADAWRMRGELDRAIDEFRLATAAADANDPLPYNNLGGALMQKGQLPEAIDCFRHSLRIDPGYVFARFNLALALANTGRDDLARTELEEVLRRDPDGGEARVQLGAILMRMGLPAQALPHLEIARRKFPHAGNVQFLCGLAMLDTGRGDDGRRVLAEIGRTDPQFADACVVLAELAAKEGARERAVQLLERALAAAPGHAGAAAMLRQLR